jgi:IS5 family transposase
MIADFDDFCTWMYVIIDDLWQQVAPLFARPGPQARCSDSELLTLAIVGECRGWDQETNLISEWHAYRHLFPHLPERSRFNRRRRQLALGFNLVRQLALRLLDVAQNRQCVLDSLPVPVVEFHLVPTASSEWAAHGAAFGKVSTKKQTIYGYKLHLLVTLGGVILDFVLAPANAHDSVVGFELLENHTDLTVIGDKAYIHATRTAELRQQQRVDVLTLPRANQKRQVSAAYRRLLNQARQIIETVNGQLAAQFHVETNHAHSVQGLCARLYTKLAAHTLCIYLNRLLGNPDFLQIKQLAFPI